MMQPPLWDRRLTAASACGPSLPRNLLLRLRRRRPSRPGARARALRCVVRNRPRPGRHALRCVGVMRCIDALRSHMPHNASAVSRARAQSSSHETARRRRERSTRVQPGRPSSVGASRLIRTTATRNVYVTLDSKGTKAEQRVPRPAAPTQAGGSAKSPVDERREYGAPTSAPRPSLSACPVRMVSHGSWYVVRSQRVHSGSRYTF